MSILTAGRNAWQNTSSKRYSGAAVMFSNVNSARSAVEPRRKQGTVFYAFEAPALILRTHFAAVALLDIHPADPFAGWQPIATDPRSSGLRPGMPISEALQIFRDRRGSWQGPVRSVHSLLIGAPTSMQALLALTPRPDLRSATSRPQGSGRVLGWTRQESRYSRHNTEHLADRFRVLTEAIPEYRQTLAQAHVLDRSVTKMDGVWRGATHWKPLLGLLHADGLL